MHSYFFGTRNLQQETETFYVLPGNEYGWLNDHAKNQFFSQFFTIENQSDRMGFRLSGESLARDIKDELISSPVTAGTIQLLPSGQVMILMADHQTTGGYPRLAHIISAQQGMLAQKKPGQKIRFQLTDHATAEELMMKQRIDLLQLQHACSFKLEQWFDKAQLHNIK